MRRARDIGERCLRSWSDGQHRRAGSDLTMVGDGGLSKCTRRRTAKQGVHRASSTAGGYPECREV
jgi:hypothetical protein